ncbi:MAG TPA: hypothetical protein EYN06_07810 [Myxococcales bacterium]|nr:hypothetical protein [Myxococcales bacterium]HIN86371.1 hypothetical protein [Myxococcales bacterium]
MPRGAEIRPQALWRLVATLEVNKGTKAVPYCKTKSMSTKATKDLVQWGDYNVFDLTGGSMA